MTCAYFSLFSTNAQFHPRLRGDFLLTGFTLDELGVGLYIFDD